MSPTRLVYLLLLPAFGIVAAFLFGLTELVAGSMVVDGSLSIGRYRDFFIRPDLPRVLLYTHEVALATTAICAVIGYPLAAYVARYKGNRNYLILPIILPWLVSIVVRTFGWMVVLGPRGIINETLSFLGLIDRPLRLMFNTTGVIIGLVHVFLPLMVMSVIAVFLSLNRQVEEASANLGAGPIRTFLWVIWPLTLPGMLSGMVLVYLMSIGAIVTPVLMGGLSNTLMGTQIYQGVFQMFDFPQAATEATILVLSALLVIVPVHLYERRLIQTRRH